MDHLLGAVHLPPTTTSYLDHPIFSPQSFDLEQLDVEALLQEDDNSNAAAAAMEIVAHLELEEVAPAPLQANGHGHHGPHSAGAVVVSPPTDIVGVVMVKAPGETDGTGGHMDLSTTATNREIIDHFRASVEHRKEVPKFDDDLVHLEPWNLPVNKRYYRATNMVSSDDKTLEGGCWKEEEFLGTRRLGPHGGKELPFIGLRRTLDFYKEDGAKTEWRMIESISLRVSDGHLFLEDDYGVTRHVYQDPTFEFFDSNTSSRISGEDEEDNQNRATLQGDCLHHHHTVQNNQAPSQSSGKRPRTDHRPKKTKLNVWQHFTRIYSEVPKEAGSSKSKKDGKKLVYAVCNYCDKVFKADSKQGTSHHSRHAESCLRKHSHPSSSKCCSQDIPRG